MFSSKPFFPEWLFWILAALAIFGAMTVVYIVIKQIEWIYNHVQII